MGKTNFGNILDTLKPDLLIYDMFQAWAVAWFARSADAYWYRPSRNRNGGNQYDTDPRIADITISAMTQSDLIDIGQFEYVMHDISRYIRVNFDLIRIFFKLYLF